VERAGSLARSKRFRVVATCAAGALVALGLVACVPVKEPGAPPVITASPALFPGFDRGISDYVDRCAPGTPTNVQVNAPDGTVVSVNGSPPASGQFSVDVPQNVDQAFTITVTDGGGTTTHFVRCLPTDFPNFSVEKNGPTQAQFYATALVQGFGTPDYSAVFDSNGVPVWWLPRKPTFLLQPFSNGHLAIVKLNGGMEEYSLDGQLQQSLNTVGANADFHDVVLLPNGHYVMATAQNMPCDLSSWGLGPALKTCVDHVFQELDPLNPNVPVWTWDTEAHIPPTETADAWIADQTSQTRTVYDPWHYNSIESTGDGFILSFRHLDAVYRIDKTLGTIVWKLSGKARPESLAIVNDPLNGVDSQHDARLLPDGSVTLHDNGTNGQGPPRQPRAVRYILDTQAKTATFAGSLTDPEVSSSGCCGSARLLPGGDIVTGWGGTPQIAEYAPDGTRLFRISGTFVYRGTPLLPGDYTAQQFRDGMDAQFAAGLSTQAAEAPADLGSSPLAATLASEQCCLKR
jgi:Arylsulfotransferase (ASST)